VSALWDNYAATNPRSIGMQVYRNSNGALPFSVTETPNLVATYKYPGGGWAQDYVLTLRPWPVVKSSVFWLQTAYRREGGSNTYRLSVSANGRDYTQADNGSGSGANITDCNAAGYHCTGTTRMDYIGSELGSSSAANNPANLIIKISSFRWSSE
jgi:hypothetical protein